MLKTGHLIFNTAALVMNRYKNRAETGLQNLDNRAILCKVRGIGAAGSAFASHVKGRGFESHMLHGKGLVDTRPFIFVLNFLTAGSDFAFSALRERVRFFLPVQKAVRGNAFLRFAIKESATSADIVDVTLSLSTPLC